MCTPTSFSADAVPTGPCRAKNPSECRYHGAFFQMNMAASKGDTSEWLKARMVIDEAEKDEFVWLEKEASQLNLRDADKRFFAEDDVRIYLFRQLMHQQQEEKVRGALDSVTPTAEAASRGVQQAIYRAMEHLGEGRPTVKRRNLLSRPMTGEKFTDLSLGLRNKMAHYVEDFLPYQQENIVRGKFRVSVNSPWESGVIEFSPYPYDREGMWINMRYRSARDEDGARGSVASGGYYKDVEEWLSITEVSDNVKDFALNKYDPSSTEPNFRNAYYEAAEGLRWSEAQTIQANGGQVFPRWV